MKNAITSYINILSTVISLNIPPKLKNGKLLYKNTLIGFFNINDKTNIKNIPTKDTNSLVNPLLNPNNAPKAKNIKIIIPTISIPFTNIIILQKIIKRK